jgi:hypothetical protein
MMLGGSSVANHLTTAMHACLSSVEQQVQQRKYKLERGQTVQTVLAYAIVQHEGACKHESKIEQDSFQMVKQHNCRNRQRRTFPPFLWAPFINACKVCLSCNQTPTTSRGRVCVSWLCDC